MKALVSAKDVLLILPELTVLATAVLVLIVDAWGRSRESYLNILCAFGLALAAYFNFHLFGDYQSAFSYLVLRDKLAFLANYLFIFCAFVTCFYARDYLVREGRNYGEFYGLVLFATVSMMFITSSANLILFFLCLELMSVCLYALAGFVRDRDLCVEASLKYFLVGAFSAGFSVLGMGLIFAAAGSLDLVKLVSVKPNLLFVLGLTLFAVSFFFKLSAAPFHVWAPDVYQGSPAPVTGFMMTAAKAAILIFIVRFFLDAFSANKELWINLVMFISVVSMLVGNFAAIRQMDVKRLLAYSSIAHAGYALVALAAGGKIGATALVYYAVAYCLMNLGAFAVISVLAGEGERSSDLEKLQGVAVEHPVLAASLAVFLFSLAGMPGTIGFMGKLYVFAAGLKSGLYWLVLLALINSAIAAYYYLKVVYYMFMREPVTDYPIRMGVATGIVVLLLVILVIQNGVAPSQLYSIIASSLP